MEAARFNGVSVKRVRILRQGNAPISNGTTPLKDVIVKETELPIHQHIGDFIESEVFVVEQYTLCNLSLENTAFH